jgi:GT2 family glycosyltransferase
MEKIGIILVNYNGYEDTIECIESLQNISYRNIEIIVIDNASTEIVPTDKIQFIKNHSHYYRVEENLGFSGGNNIGIEMAKQDNCDFVVLLNNDTTVEPEFLSKLIETYDSTDNIGIITGKIYYYYDKSKIWSAGGLYNRNTGVTTQYGGDDSDLNNTSRSVTFATGCLMLIPISVIDNVGKLSESYFLYSEDTDYCQRVLDAGYLIYYCANSVIYHKVSASVGNMSALQERYMMRNNLYMIQKFSNLKPFSYLYFFLHTAKDIVRGRNHIKPVCEGASDFFHRRKGKIIER